MGEIRQRKEIQIWGGKGKLKKKNEQDEFLHQIFRSE